MVGVTLLLTGTAKKRASGGTVPTKAKRGSKPGKLSGPTPRLTLVRLCAGTNLRRGQWISTMAMDEAWAQCVALLPADKPPPEMWMFAPKDDAALLLTMIIRKHTGCEDIQLEDVCSFSSADTGGRALFYLPKDGKHCGGLNITQRFKSLLAGKSWPPVDPVTVADGEDSKGRPLYTLAPVLPATGFTCRARPHYAYRRPRAWRHLYFAYHGFYPARQASPRAPQAAPAAMTSPRPVIPKGKRSLRRTVTTNTQRLTELVRGEAPRRSSAASSPAAQPPPDEKYRPGVYAQMDALVEASQMVSQMEDMQLDGVSALLLAADPMPLPAHIPNPAIPTSAARQSKRYPYRDVSQQQLPCSRGKSKRC